VKLLATIGGILLAAALFAKSPAHAPRNVDQKDFEVSDGRIESVAQNRFMVSSSEMRATIPGTSGQDIAVDFVYLGPTREISRLADSELRHQFGVKLRSQDTCNNVYVMWHFDESQIVVQVKKNSGKKTHADCGDRGYITVKKFAVPHVRVNESHSLAARINGEKLSVVANGISALVKLPVVAFTFNGPAGLRSDNVQVIFNYKVDR